MKNMNESFDDELRKRLRQYSEEPRAQLWQNITTRVDAERRPLTLQKRTKTGWILLLGLLSVGGLYYFQDSRTIKEESVSHSVSKQDQANPTQRPVEEVEGDKPSLPQQKSNVKENEIHASSERIHEAEAGISRRDVSEVTSVPSTIKNPDILSENNREVLSNNSVPDLSGKEEENFIAVKAGEDSTAMQSIVKEEKVSAEENETVIKEKGRKHNRFNIYFTIMPTFGYQRINSNSNDNIIIESIGRVSAFSTERLGVRAELGAEHPITDRLKVFGGLVYYQRKQTIDYTEKQVDNTNVSQGDGGDIIVEPEFIYVNKSFEYELQNLGFQVGLSYQLSKKVLLQTAGTGIEFHVALNKFHHPAQTAEFTNNPSAYVFYNLYYRIQYPTEGRLKAVLQPTLNYSFYINENFNAPFYVKPYGLGLNVGFTYTF
jgi:hypothetical protein